MTAIEQLEAQVAALREERAEILADYRKDLQRADKAEAEVQRLTEALQTAREAETCAVHPNEPIVPACLKCWRGLPTLIAKIRAKCEDEAAGKPMLSHSRGYRDACVEILKMLNADALAALRWTSELRTEYCGDCHRAALALKGEVQRLTEALQTARAIADQFTGLCASAVKGKCDYAVALNEISEALAALRTAGEGP
jgi:hypothetical protein